jgi:prepilin-type N-terminal cleavage/methylation domain-containing protein
MKATTRAFTLLELLIVLLIIGILIAIGLYRYQSVVESGYDKDAQAALRAAVINGEALRATSGGKTYGTSVTDIVDKLSNNSDGLQYIAWSNNEPSVDNSVLEPDYNSSTPKDILVSVQPANTMVAYCNRSKSKKYFCTGASSTGFTVASTLQSELLPTLVASSPNFSSSTSTNLAAAYCALDTPNGKLPRGCGQTPDSPGTDTNRTDGANQFLDTSTKKGWFGNGNSNDSSASSSPSNQSVLHTRSNSSGVAKTYASKTDGSTNQDISPNDSAVDNIVASGFFTRTYAESRYHVQVLQVSNDGQYYAADLQLYKSGTFPCSTFTAGTPDYPFECDMNPSGSAQADQTYYAVILVSTSNKNDVKRVVDGNSTNSIIFAPDNAHVLYIDPVPSDLKRFNLSSEAVDTVVANFPSGIGRLQLDSAGDLMTTRIANRAIIRLNISNTGQAEGTIETLYSGQLPGCTSSGNYIVLYDVVGTNAIVGPGGDVSGACANLYLFNLTSNSLTALTNRTGWLEVKAVTASDDQSKLVLNVKEYGTSFEQNLYTISASDLTNNNLPAGSRIASNITGMPELMTPQWAGNDVVFTTFSSLYVFKGSAATMLGDAGDVSGQQPFFVADI